MSVHAWLLLTGSVHGEQVTVLLLRIDCSRELLKASLTLAVPNVTGGQQHREGVMWKWQESLKRFSRRGHLPHTHWTVSRDAEQLPSYSQQHPGLGVWLMKIGCTLMMALHRWSGFWVVCSFVFSGGGPLPIFKSPHVNPWVGNRSYPSVLLGLAHRVSFLLL